MKKFLLIILGFTSLVCLDAQCVATSIAGGHIIYNDISLHPIPWVNLPGAENSDNIRTTTTQTVATNTTPHSSGLWAQTFLFSVPSNGVICGIEVQIERRQTGAFPGISSVKDRFVQLISNMTVVGTNHANPTEWNSTEQIETYGGSGDLWGLSLTPTLVNAPDFGVALATNFENTGTSVTLSAQIDRISLKIYYTIALPVELLDFNAELSDRNVNLLWQTASESNNAEFIIERSTDAINWTTVGTVAGGGTHNNLTNYSWLDQNAPNGTLYYNLKQRDHNGEIQQLASTTITVSGNNEMDLHYNPSTSIVQIFGKKNESSAQLNIMNVSGKTVFTSSINTDQNEILIDQNLTSGIYFFELTTNEKTMVKKIMIQN